MKYNSSEETKAKNEVDNISNKRYTFSNTERDRVW